VIPVFGEKGNVLPSIGAQVPLYRPRVLSDAAVFELIWEHRVRPTALAVP
jgi:hypothetical protein